MSVEIEQFSDVPVPYPLEEPRKFDGVWQFANKEFGVIFSKETQSPDELEQETPQIRPVIHVYDPISDREVMTLKKETIRAGGRKSPNDYFWESTFTEKGLSNVTIGSESPTGELFKSFQTRAETRLHNYK